MRQPSYLCSLCIRLVILLLLVFAIIKCEHAKGQTIAGPLALSREGYDLIVEYEVGGKAYYQSRLSKPTWPGGASGVTIGIGYDLGYNTRAQIAADWSALLASDKIAALQSVAGLKGQSARVAVARVRGVVIPWETALAVFERRTLSRFGALTAGAFPAAGAQHPHGQSALVSLVFNRGSSLSGDSRQEMRWIRYNLTAHPERVPGDFRAMRRLWIGKGLDGLLIRRNAEAALFQRGLDAARVENPPRPPP